jgi:hypothetical protein
MYDRRRATGSKTIVLAGYLVRFPLGGYFWQAVHYLLGFRALGYYGRAGVDFLRHRLLAPSARKAA